MSAERLRKVAADMRAKAEAATPGPWSLYSTLTHRCIKSDAPSLGARVNTLVGMAAESKPYNAAHIAAWHPAVALAVASLLASVADVEEYGNSVGPRIKADCLAVCDAWEGR